MENTQAAIPGNEECSSLLFESLPQGIICVDANGRVISANRAMAHILGLPAGQLTGMTPSDPRLRSIHEDGTDYAVDSLPVQIALGTGQPVRDRVIGMLNHAEESYRWLSCNAVPVFRNGEDRAYRAYATFDDITDRHLAFKALQESESRTAALLENTEDAIWSVDSEFRLIVANSAARKLYAGLFGASLVEGMDIRPAMAQAIRHSWEEAGALVLEGGQAVFEHQYEMAGAPADIEFSLGPITSHAGRVTGISCFARNITGRNKMERQLKENEKLFRMAVQSSSDFVWDWDISSGRVAWYGDIEGMLGYSPGEFPSTIEAWKRALHPDDHDRVIAACSGDAGSGESCNIEYRVVRKDGLIRNWIDRGMLIRDEAGRAVRRVGACVDITAHRQSEAMTVIRRDLALKLSGRVDMEQALKHCLDAAIEISGFDTGVIYVLEQESGDFIAACYYGASAYLLQHYSVLKADSVDARFLKKGSPYYIKPEEFTPPFDEQLKPEGFTFDATIPVLYQGQIIASLGIFSHTRDSMPAIVRDSLEIIAADIGVIIDRISSRQALRESEEELRAALERLGSSLESTIDALAMMSELRDPYTAGHQRRVTQLAIAIAAELGLPDDRIQPLRVAGLLHDVGKIHVPSEILSKPGRLTHLEMGLARAHAVAGYEVVAAIKFPWPIADIVVQHHERMDGSGYPAGLKGEEIKLEARILAVADVTEAMMSHRPYRPSLGMDQALAEITANRGNLYDENAVDACVRLLTGKGFNFRD